MDALQETMERLQPFHGKDDSLIKEITDLSETKGARVYQSFFKSLTNLELSSDKARSYWFGVLEHKKQLSQTLQRNISLIAALSDYLSLHHDAEFSPCLIDTKIVNQIRTENVEDKLTGLNNRSYFDQVFEQQLSLAKRYNTDLSLLFLDIDNFKEINDRYGHQAGDTVLRNVASIIKQKKRQSDIAVRYGGEEFILLMPHTGNINGFILAERIREAIASRVVRHNDAMISLTVSGGLASYPVDGNTTETILASADQAVYLAKGAGKNLISLFKRDKRRFLRVKFDSPVYVKELDIQPTMTHLGEGKDICIGGILFESKDPLLLNATIQMYSQIGNSKELFLIGKVVRVESYESGHYDIGVEISFNEMEKIAKEEIAGLIKSVQ